MEKVLRPTKAIGYPIEIVDFRDAEDEARSIVGEIRRRAIEGVGWEDMAVLYVNPSVADRLSLLVDRTGYREMLRASKAETDEGRLDNLAELIQLAASF